MKAHFFISPGQVNGQEARITGPDVNHIKNVLRMKPGEELVLGDGTWQYDCRIRMLATEAVTAEVLERHKEEHELPVSVTVFQGLPKAEKLELVIQKCVELGAGGIVPVRMKRCVVKLDEDKAAKKLPRWQGIAESAAKQSGRGILPQVLPVMDFSAALDMASGFDHILLPYELATDMEGTRRVLAQVKPGERLAVFIGPEGGIEESEAEAAVAAGAKPITLGRRILRTETAAMAFLAMLAYATEDPAR